MRKVELDLLLEEAEKHGITGVRAKMSGIVTRGNLSLFMPFTVIQGEKSCAYVTLSKCLLSNLFGLMMDTEMTQQERLQLQGVMKMNPIRTSEGFRFLNLYTGVSTKAYILILCFYYLFDWIKKHDMRPYVLLPSRKITEVNGPHKGMKDFNEEMPKLYDFLKLKVKRLGGTTFSGSSWITAITTALEGHASSLKWKRTELCVLHSIFSQDSHTFTQSHFRHFLNEIVLPITNSGIKIILTLFDGNGLHDVMLVGLENECLLISNSWGYTIDVVPIERLPRLSLVNSELEWLLLQFIFLLPVHDTSIDDLGPHYDLSNYAEFETIMKRYRVPTFDKVKFTAEMLGPKGGKRKSKRNKAKRTRRK